MIRKLLLSAVGLLVGLGLFAAGLLAIAILATYPKLPSLEAVTHYQPKMPLTIYSADGKLMGQFGEERRAFTRINDFPQVLKDAVVAAEDKRFYEHSGVDFIGIIRALISNMTGGVQSGASTITQQVARNFYLTNERTYTRKFNEALLAYKIEQKLTKDQILELYFNQIYLGQRAYGFAAASLAYFNKPVQKLDLAEATILAGLPKAPSTFNPVVNPQRAKMRQRYILNNMVELGKITPAQADAAFAEPLQYVHYQQAIDQNALYVAELVRQQMYEKYGDAAYTQGFRVYTTVNSQDQAVATQALRKVLTNFDKSSVYRGAEGFFDLSKIPDDIRDEQIEQYLANRSAVDGMLPAVVTALDSNSIVVYIAGVGESRIGGNSYNWIKRAISNAKLGEASIRIGSVVHVRSDGKSFRVVQQPELQGAIVALDAQTGAVRALVGGYDYYRRSFNRATQAKRQPGSSFKPFIYSAAIAKGFTPATMVNDAPIVLPGLGAGGRAWTPKNSDGRYAGFITLRQALTASKNMVSIRILMAMGIDYARQYVQHFGFRSDQIPNSLSMALGSGQVTPMQMAEGYAIFANGGFKVSNYVIDRVYDSRGNLRAQMQPLVANQNAPLAIDPRNAYILYHMMKDVVNHGTAYGARALGRSDIAGKTGTTNDNKDAWFVGFNPNVVSAVYIGFDRPRSMGRSAFGGTIALPVWLDYMRYALKGKPIVNTPVPSGIVQKSGEYFLKEYQTTNPDLPLDNRADGPVTPRTNDSEGADDAGEIPIAPQSGNNGQLDSLF
ncbi:penicillin-binding protein 1A [Snodgrassella alvi]|jgi:penicillin-binding protein 1A|uniref:Penicillin-binding protein 1A n=1 Tax=Snodgrassella alvi TaxID=1196083 RepID=A0A2N9XZQ9_9NEIS|nr:penicillin-binding protein 1A [Snodgrassella alvi]PIT56948.1 peptidase [Snodgrassella alvi]PIT57403.1 peptidase [Snodgrassella alvi]